MQKAGVRISFSENFHKGANFSSILNIQFSGLLLGALDPDTNLDGFSLWSDIQIHLDCNKKSFHKFLPNIGNHTYGKYIEKQGKTLLSPLKLRISLKGCKKDEIKRIKLAFIEKHLRHGQKKEVIVWELD